MSETPMIQAMVWYRREVYLKLLEIFVDYKLLPTTYDEWLGKAEENKKNAEESGDTVVKVFIEPDSFPAWCKLQGKAPDKEARTEFAIQVVMSKQFGDKT